MNPKHPGWYWLLKPCWKPIFYSGFLWYCLRPQRRSFKCFSKLYLPAATWAAALHTAQGICDVCCWASKVELQTSWVTGIKVFETRWTLYLQRHQNIELWSEFDMQKKTLCDLNSSTYMSQLRLHFKWCSFIFNRITLDAVMPFICTAPIETNIEAMSFFQNDTVFKQWSSKWLKMVKLHQFENVHIFWHKLGWFKRSKSLS